MISIKVDFRAAALEAGGDDRGDAVDRAHQQDKGVKVRGLRIQGGQLKIKVEGPRRRRGKQVDLRVVRADMRY